MEKPKFRIGFDINGVLRNTIGKIEQTYDKFYLSQTDGVEDENDFQYEMNLPVTSLDLKEHFKFFWSRSVIRILNI